MRRRIFLIAAFSVTAGTDALSLSGRADVRQHIAHTLVSQPPTVPHTSLSTLLKAFSIPTDFGGETVWPLRVRGNQDHPWLINAMVETARGSFLIAYDVNSDDEAASLSGDRLILVDLKGSTTYGIVPEDSEHGYRTESTAAPPVGGVPADDPIAPNPGTSVTEQFTCTATCDDKFAYLIAGREDILGERLESRGRVNLLKIRLANRRIVANALLGENFALKAREPTYRAGSLIMLTSGGADLLVTTNVPHRALRLSAEGPSAQFDLASITSRNFCMVSGGETVALLGDDAKVHAVTATFANGPAHPIEDLSAQLVHQGYLYATDSRTKEPPYPKVSINLTTGERTGLANLSVDKKDKHPTPTAGNGHVIRRTDYIRIRKNGSAIPLLTRRSIEGESYQSAATYGSIPYLALSGNRPCPIDLGVGKVIPQSSTGGQYEIVTVTPYGFCNESAFYPVAAWKF